MVKLLVWNIFWILSNFKSTKFFLAKLTLNNQTKVRNLSYHTGNVKLANSAKKQILSFSKDQLVVRI